MESPLLTGQEINELDFTRHVHHLTDINPHSDLQNPE